MTRNRKWFHIRNAILIIVMLFGIFCVVYPFTILGQCGDTCTNDQAESATLGGGAIFFFGCLVVFSDLFAIILTLIFSRYKRLSAEWKFAIAALYLPFMFLAFTLLFLALGDGYGD